MTILLAEDEKPFSKALCRILRHFDCTVEPVYNGKEALEAIHKNDYDAAVLDIMMPVMDGITVVKTLRREKNPIPIIMLTAKSELDDRCNGLDSGADDYLNKPVEAKELIARLNAITRRASEELDPQNIEKGNINLNCATNELKSPSGTFCLTKREFQLMKLLLSTNKEKKLDENHIIQKVWKDDSEANTLTVKLYISYLQKKLSLLGASFNVVEPNKNTYRLENYA